MLRKWLCLWVWYLGTFYCFHSSFVCHIPFLMFCNFARDLWLWSQSLTSNGQKDIGKYHIFSVLIKYLYNVPLPLFRFFLFPWSPSPDEAASGWEACGWGWDTTVFPVMAFLYHLTPNQYPDMWKCQSWWRELINQDTEPWTKSIDASCFKILSLGITCYAGLPWH